MRINAAAKYELQVAHHAALMCAVAGRAQTRAPFGGIYKSRNRRRLTATRKSVKALGMARKTACYCAYAREMIVVFVCSSCAHCRREITPYMPPCDNPLAHCCAEHDTDHSSHFIARVHANGVR
jgi:hypothetical protein